MFEAFIRCRPHCAQVSSHLISRTRGRRSSWRIFASCLPLDGQHILAALTASSIGSALSCEPENEGRWSMICSAVEFQNSPSLFHGCTKALTLCTSSLSPHLTHQPRGTNDALVLTSVFDLRSTSLHRPSILLYAKLYTTSFSSGVR